MLAQRVTWRYVIYSDDSNHRGDAYGFATGLP
jgi:hypothetical protein